MALFPPAFAVPVRNRKNGCTYSLTRADKVGLVPARLAEITRICNEPLVYANLFSQLLGGKPYTLEAAATFMSWALDGWRRKTHYVFLALGPAGDVAAAADIKSPDLGAGEVGYWASAAHAGIGTPMVGSLCDLARTAGYQSLYARVRPGNERSQTVLLTNGFTLASPAGTGTHATYQKVLATPAGGSR